MINKYEKSKQMLIELKSENPNPRLEDLREKYAQVFGVIDNVAITRAIKSLAMIGLIKNNQNGTFEINVEE